MKEVLFVFTVVFLGAIVFTAMVLGVMELIRPKPMIAFSSDFDYSGRYDNMMKYVRISVVIFVVLITVLALLVR